MCVWTSCGAQASTASGREWKDLAGCKNRRGRDIGYALAADSCEEAGSVDACTIAAPDAITAFAVPNPNCSSQSQSVFSGLVARQVSSPSGSPSLLQTSPMLLAPILSADVTYDHRTGDTGSQCRFLVHFADGKRTLHVPFGGKEKACGAGGLNGFGIFQLASFFCLRRSMLRAGRRSVLRRVRTSRFNSRRVRRRVFRCIRSTGAAFDSFQLASRRTVRTNCFLNSRTASE